MRPLHTDIAKTTVEWEGGNTGLWYDKFFDKWQGDWSIKDGDKQEWVKTVTGTRCGDKDQLQQAKQRMQRLLENADSQPLFYKLESDFVTGLGRQHPVENGFAWHHTLGTPYLPGSSVKGMVRAWAEQWEDPRPDNAGIKRIFGSETKEDKDFHVGAVIFLDAIPISPVRLKADIMTPHYSPYYRGEAPPADWHSPNPIPFLVVEQGISFVFGILPRRKEDAADCEVVRGWLEEALAWTGAGAKTAVGYGRFAEDVEARQRAEKEREQERALQQEREEQEQRQHEIEEQTQGKSPLYAGMFRASIEGNWREDKNAFSQPGLIEEWLNRLEAEPQPDAVNLFHDFMRIHYGDVLDNPDATKGKKARPKHKDRPRNFARHMLKLLEETQ